MSEKRGTLRVIAAANFIFAALFLIFSLPFFWHQLRVLQTWPETDAQVLQSEVVAGPPAGHENLYRAQLKVLYTVAGQPITAEMTSFESTNYEATLQPYPGVRGRQPPSRAVRCGESVAGSAGCGLEPDVFCPAADSGGDGRVLCLRRGGLSGGGKGIKQPLISTDSHGWN